ncbi:MAG: NADH-quinone oxidoreductase subunit C [Candidatus Latescibacteria bacterium]|nr:NADH-quinone oxidoreductase subunit C [Candidatus Latescibacterota bacterium]NIM66395.1 NADH-quinone oxidoreductase subunit C [Candidatus Latescibacterota bacterium]NIO02874.1 NADH-quinone oxidoreductase subunit C [Candidatus Latescibacterota bacterium]NIO30009.1 NADH-quinone oxidoreductase subunit C [Candidatus Latescibacterota bacterium]NIO57624.1 NADH-quinone oxidoreductase subunit C [Candidatus Latescibacterota bacterium]
MAEFPGVAFELIEENTDHPYLVIPAERTAGICRFLRDDPDLRLDALSNLSSVDEGEILTVVYHLFSYEHRHYSVLKVRVPRGAPDVPTVQTVWPGAGWFEREAYDLMGINFMGHNDLRRIMLPDDWVGHPLRKDWVEQEEYHGMGTSRNEPMDVLPLADAPEKEKQSD